jgi:hypothetical protein
MAMAEFSPASFDVVAARLARDRTDVEEGRIFHSRGVKTAGKFFAFLRGEELVLKLPEDRVSELIAAGEGLPFDAGRGTPMREWVRVRPESDAKCAAYVEEAREFVSGARAR